MYGHADEEEMLALFSDGHLLPQFSKCYLEQASCQKFAFYGSLTIPDDINWPGKAAKRKARKWLAGS